MEEVDRLWNGLAMDVPSRNPLVELDCRLRRTAAGLRSWGEKSVGNIKMQLLMAHEIILRLDVAQESRLLSVDEALLRKKLKVRCLGLASLERTIARSRSRLLWLKEGDANTSFFHIHASHRRKKNCIRRLRVDDLLVTDQGEMLDVAFDFFDVNLGRPEARSRSINFHELGILPLDLSDLEHPWTVDEIWAAIKSMPADKAPGPDGFSLLFYQKCWNYIKKEVVDAINSLFFLHDRGFGSLN
jgi:hypothetical protein